MSDQQESAPNPYANRDHESFSETLNDRSDLLAVAGLLGHVKGSLGEVDKKNVGGENQYIKASKMDPKAVLRGMVGSVPPPVAPAQQPTPQQTITQPAPQPQHAVQPVLQTQPPPVVTDTSELESRVTALERIVEAFKRVKKFKRGISYNVNTRTITGNFRSPEAILDIVANELAKQTKVITIKLDDKTKD